MARSHSFVRSISAGLAALVALVALTVGVSCGSRRSDSSSTRHNMRPGPTDTRSPVAHPPAVDGVSSEEARRNGEFASDGDATLVGPVASSAATVMLTLTNIGAVRDTYDLRSIGGSVEPRSVELAPGATAEVTLSRAGDSKINVTAVSRLQGVIVARYEQA